MEPGGLETRKALLRNGFDLSVFNLFHSLLDIGCENKFGSNPGLLTRARISPDLRSLTITAPLKLTN